MHTSISTPIPADQTQILMSSAKFSVSKYSSLWADKFRRPRFFSPEELEDLVYKVIYKACRSFHKYDPTIAKPPTWVDRIARNCVKDEVEVSDPLQIFTFYERIRYFANKVFMFCEFGLGKSSELCPAGPCSFTGLEGGLPGRRFPRA